MGPAECLRLIAGSMIGRVVFTDSALPAAQPVTYILDGHEVIFSTANGSALAAAMRDAIVAFEVDEIDLDTRAGWSVLGVGRPYEITDVDRLALLGAGSCVVDGAPHTIAIPLQRLTGRRLTLTDMAAHVVGTSTRSGAASVR
nr:pyridoxamine 5'-phosphate oxidase family protein [Pseudonocardia acidicola]